VLLARLPPFFPFPLFNYAFAVTDISFEIYMAATFIGVSPATLLDSYIGSLFSSLAALYGEDEAIARKPPKPRPSRQQTRR
jgi:uncharacterized membrane protein YdjX (TVP38/TMEM64 family)